MTLHDILHLFLSFHIINYKLLPFSLIFQHILTFFVNFMASPLKVLTGNRGVGEGVAVTG